MFIVLTVLIAISLVILFSDLSYYTCGIEEKKGKMSASDEAKFDALVLENGKYVSRKIVR